MAKKAQPQPDRPQYSKDLAEHALAAIRTVAHQAVMLNLPLEQVNWVPLISKSVEFAGWRFLQSPVRNNIVIELMTTSGLIGDGGALNVEALKALGKAPS